MKAESLTLSSAELRELTGYTRAAEQFAMLTKMGIKAHRRRDGSICVARVWVAAAAAPSTKPGSSTGPRVKRRAEEMNGGGG
mgnify:FL=1